MTSLEYDEVVEGIVDVLRSFNIYFKANRDLFSRAGSNWDKAERYNVIMDDESFVRSMVRKLNDEAVVTLYHECRVLAVNCGLTLKKPLSNARKIGLKSVPMRNDETWYSVNSKHTEDGSLGWGWGHQAPQTKMGYADEYDKMVGAFLFDIHATKFELYDGTVLRLWKGYYNRLGGIGGEIGFYGKPKKVNYGEIKVYFSEMLKRLLEIAGKEANFKNLENMVGNWEVMQINLIDTVTAQDGRLQKLVNDNVILEKAKEYFASMNIKSWIDFIKNKGQEIKEKGLEIMQKEEVVSLITTLKLLIDIIIRFKKILDEKNAKETFSDNWGCSLKPEELKENIRLVGTAIQVFYKDGNNRPLAERRDFSAVFWTTAFTGPHGFRSGMTKDGIYTVNHFYFEEGDWAFKFFKALEKGIGVAKDYDGNRPGDRPEDISFKIQGNSVIIYYGK